MQDKVLKLAGVAAGFFLLVNFQFPPGIRQGIRVTDYTGAVAWAYIFARMVRHDGFPYRLFFRSLLLCGLIVPWLVLSFLTPRTFIDPFRWFIGIGVAAGFVMLLRSPLRPYVLRGIICGAIAQVVVLAMQFLGYYDLTVALGLTSLDLDATNIVAERWRPPGMHGTNATPAVALLGIPAALGLVGEGKASKRWLVVAVLTSLITSGLTLTRSSTLVALVLMGIWGSLQTNNVKRVGTAVVIVVLGVSTIAIVGPPGGWERWEGASLESNNARVRLKTTASSFAIAVENPLGLGREGYVDELRNRSGYTATHNALTYLALAANFPLALCVFFYLVGRGSTILYRQDFEGWLAVTVFGISFWEEYFRNSVFVIIGILIVVGGMYQRHSNAHSSGSAGKADEH